MERRALAVSLCVGEHDKKVLGDVEETYGVTLSELPENLDPDLYLEFTQN